MSLFLSLYFWGLCAEFNLLLHQKSIQYTMKKAVMILALLCYTLSSFAEKKPIELEENKRPHKRSEVQLPTASIDGLVLTIDFVSSTTFEVAVVNASGVVVYTGVYSAQGAVIILPNLPVGEYQLEIEDAEHLYGGEFEIEQ